MERDEGSVSIPTFQWVPKSPYPHVINKFTQWNHESHTFIHVEMNYLTTILYYKSCISTNMKQKYKSKHCSLWLDFTMRVSPGVVCLEGRACRGEPGGESLEGRSWRDWRGELGGESLKGRAWRTWMSEPGGESLAGNPWRGEAREVRLLRSSPSNGLG